MSAAPQNVLVISFTGGMGAQILSAAIYFRFRQAGLAAFADLRYFDRPESIATTGDIGQVTHWGWALDRFGLQKSDFDTGPYPAGTEPVQLRDGPEKLRLALEALALPEVRARFALAVPFDPASLGIAPGPFACFHVRRGDYVNVASHLVSDQQFKAIIRKCAGLLDNAVIVSDSPIDAAFRSEVAQAFPRIAFLDNIDAFASHCVMRAARLLVCSNSQFSLVAAALNPDAFTIVPNRWYDDSMQAFEQPIHAHCTFQIFDLQPA